MSETHWVEETLNEHIHDEQLTSEGIKIVAELATSFAQSLVDILVDTEGNPIDWDVRADKIYTLFLDSTVLRGVISAHPSVDHKDALELSDSVLGSVRTKASWEHRNAVEAITRRLQTEHGLKTLPFV